MAEAMPKIKVTDPPGRPVASPYERPDAGFSPTIDGTLRVSLGSVSTGSVSTASANGM